MNGIMQCMMRTNFRQCTCVEHMKEKKSQLRARKASNAQKGMSSPFLFSSLSKRRERNSIKNESTLYGRLLDVRWVDALSYIDIIMHLRRHSDLPQSIMETILLARKSPIFSIMFGSYLAHDLTWLIWLAGLSAGYIFHQLSLLSRIFHQFGCLTWIKKLWFG